VDALTVTGYLSLMLTGVVLGLLGAGGSILGVPILVYLLGVSPVAATGYSLVLVGTTALVGAFQYIRRGYAHPRMAVLYGAPAMLGVYLSRRVVFPAVPDPALSVGATVVAKDTLVMLVFAAFMTVASRKMIRSGSLDDTDEYRPHRHVPAWVISMLGIAVGVLTGFVGAGGGFLILPVLVLMGGLPMRMAIGTSLLVIAVQSLIGFVGEIQAAESIDYVFVGSILVPPFVGIFAGTWLNRKAHPSGLKTAFGWFLLAVGAAIVAREVWVVS
jgi:uncharacterized membrane protein YfcA